MSLYFLRNLLNSIVFCTANSFLALSLYVLLSALLLNNAEASFAFTKEQTISSPSPLRVKGAPLSWRFRLLVVELFPVRNLAADWRFGIDKRITCNCSEYILHSKIIRLFCEQQ